MNYTNSTRLILPCIFLLLFSSAIAQQTDREILLKNIKVLPLPDSPNYVSATYIINEQPQIIAAAKVYPGYTAEYNTIVTSRFGKGKIILLGSACYLKNPLLQNGNVQQLIKNAIKWGVNTSKNSIGIWGQSKPDLQSFLSTLKTKVYVVEKDKIEKETSMLFLMEDVKDSIEEDTIKTFVKDGGTLVFGSPLSDIFNKLASEKNEAFYHLKLNPFFIKAGLYHVYNPAVPGINNTQLITDSFPSYAHINTLMPVLYNSGYETLKGDNDFKTRLADATLKLTVACNDLDAPIIKKMISYFNINMDSAIVPSIEYPVKKSNTKQYFAYYIQHLLTGRKLEINPDTLYIAPASHNFPGDVSKSAVSVNEDCIVDVRVKTQGLLEPPSIYYRPHSTGYYIPAGKKVIISLNHKDVSQHLKAQIGVHEDDLMHMDELTREGFDLTSKFDLDKDTTTIFSAYGGLLYINIADTATVKTIAFHINGAVKAPYFKLNKTSNKDWEEAIKNIDAPWTELVTDKIILTVPSYRIVNLHNPAKLLKFWDEVMDADAELADISKERTHAEHIIIDREVAAGYMYTSFAKITAPDDESCVGMLNENDMRSKGSWGHFHELGHRHQFGYLDFDAVGEVTPNLFSMYVYDKVLHKGIYSADDIASKKMVTEKVKKYLADKPGYEKWSNDPFLALCMYIELIEGFGWQPIIDVNKVYRALPKEKYPVSDADRRDYWFVEICRATNKNLTSFFDTWKVPVSDKAKLQVNKYATWMPVELQ